MRCLLFFVVLCRGALCAHLALPQVEVVDAAIKRVQEEFHVPGAAIALLIDGKVAMVRTYGYRDALQTLPVTENTLFAIASCSKSFTTHLLGQLVDEGKIAWDVPVAFYLPHFRLQDGYATEHLTVRDLVTHQSGLPGHNLLWYGSELSSKEIFYRLQYLDPTSDLRQTIQYNNLMYMVAGLLIEEVTSQPLSKLLQDRIFSPLHMDRANTSLDLMIKDEDFATPFTLKDNRLQSIPFVDPHNIIAAGGINASVLDVAKWLEFQLTGNTDQISDKTLKDLHAQQVAFGLPFQEKGHWLGYGIGWPSGYGLGWVTGIHEGRYILSHAGALDGFDSVMGFLPKEKVGVVVLLNSLSHYVVAQNLAEQLLSELLTGKSDEWIDDAKKAAVRFEEMPIPSIPETCVRPFIGYQGTYEHPGYGKCRVYDDAGMLFFRYNNFSSPLIHVCYEHFKIKTALSYPMIVSFGCNLQGDITNLAATLEPASSPVIFAKIDLFRN